MPPGLNPQAAIVDPWAPIRQAVRQGVQEAIAQNAAAQARLQPLNYGRRTDTGHVLQATAGISWEEAKALLSDLASDVKESMKTQSSGFLEALNQDKVCPGSLPTSCDQTVEQLQEVLRSIEALREGVESLSTTLPSKINVQMQEEAPKP
ncbi:hypothetical protein ACHAPK_010729, partial [Fusarium culmorum]